MEDLDILQLDEIVQDFIQTLKNEIYNAKGDTRLAKKISRRITVGTSNIEITISLPGYFAFINDGVNGYQNNQGSKYSFKNNGKPIPVKPLEEWIMVKNIPLPGIKGITAKRYAYMLSHSIKRKGIKGSHILESTLKEFDLEKRLINNMVSQIQKKIKEELLNDIKKTV